MPRLEGKLTRKQRVEIANDVIALCRSQQRKIKIRGGAYFFAEGDKERDLLRAGGQLTSKRLPACRVCARGALFIASVDRNDQCDLAEIDSVSDGAQSRSIADWGEQAYEIEDVFEGGGGEYWPADPKKRLIAIMENIVANNGEFKPVVIHG